ncbi:RidA family protein [Cognataquiflexum rubidum]|uniref:RidA family protein n=1 Tax=Cognataquiflexum rubidum TaxID=2922273 RepID=UPI001F13E1E1|nr:RidA family protein [Cognataquiflexum rubidum]MCH6233005.1 RidA family protein [Cognataquiflexum rubidum]
MKFKAFFSRFVLVLTPMFLTLFSISCNSPEVQSEQPSELIWDAEQKLKDLGIVLPEASSPVANYVNAVRSGNLLFLAGKGPGLPDGTFITGKVGQDLTIEEGKEAARMVAINQLAVLKAELGDLNKVKRVVKVLGMVNCNSDFTQQPQVINGFSDLMVEVFGEKGKHARSAVGMNALPMNIAVEVELIVEIEDN